MRAARFHGQSDIRIEDVALPEIKTADEVLVEVLWCGICGTDLHEYLVGPIVTPTTPHPLTGVTLPQTLGHEFSARVVEVGPQVTDVAVGDRVAIMPAIVCGRCTFCRQGLGHLCVPLRVHRTVRRDRGTRPVRRAQGVPGLDAARRGLRCGGRRRRAGQRGGLRHRPGRDPRR